MELSDDQAKEIAAAILAGNTIAAIKLYREATGLGLKEAKTAIDHIRAELAGEHPEALQKQKAGCAPIVILGFLLITTAATVVFSQYTAG